MSMVKNITSGLIVRKKMLRLKNCEKENMSFQIWPGQKNISSGLMVLKDDCLYIVILI